jgi:dTDP-4-amino-4,6-dideoxygalactose transaminase
MNVSMKPDSQRYPDRLRVLRPQLPVADKLLPYLRSIDATRTYSNHGPLASALESRLCKYFRMPDGGVICTASGTAALEGAILGGPGRASPGRPLAVIPAFTFVATAAAVQQCGYEPYLLDVAPDSWMLDPVALLTNDQLHKVGLVVPVAPFGRPVPQQAWRTFMKETGIPVVIDGAASFDTATLAREDHLGDIPVVFSFHATKSFGTGEGGAVVCSDTERVKSIWRSLNFGFYEKRDSQSASTNGKMSEFGAAVGLAELDGWQAKYSQWAAVMDVYRATLEAVQLGHFLTFHPTISVCYALLTCQTASQASKVEEALDRADIDCRLWYGAGVHQHSFFRDAARGPLDVTDDILPRLIGLPVAPDLASADIQRVAAAVRAALS